jgi:YD repeat-containing protein
MSETLEKKQVRKMKKYSGSLKEIKNNELAGPEILTSETHYFPDGRIQQEFRYNRNGVVEEKHEYIYDEEGRILLHNWSMPMDEVEQSEKTERNEKGKVVREVKLYYGEEGESVVYDYDEKGRVIHLKQADEEGTTVQEEFLEYNDQDKLVAKRVMDSNGRQIMKTEYTYNDAGLLTGQVEYDDKDAKISQTVIEIDDKGNDVSLIQYNAKNEVKQRLHNTYDEQNRITRRLASGTFTRIYIYEYDENGKLCDEHTTDEHGNTISRSGYTFDEEGRMIHETSYEMDLTHSGRGMAMAYRYEYEF